MVLLCAEAVVSVLLHFYIIPNCVVFIREYCLHSNAVCDRRFVFFLLFSVIETNKQTVTKGCILLSSTVPFERHFPGALDQFWHLLS